MKAAQYLVVGWLPSPAVERGDLSRGERRDQLLCVEPFKGSTGQRERQMEQEFTVCDCLPALRNLAPNSFPDALPHPTRERRSLSRGVGEGKGNNRVEGRNHRVCSRYYGD